MANASDVERALDMHRWMVQSRVLEDRLIALWKQGQIRGRVLTGRGQEAIPTGVAMAAKPTDFMCPMHRTMAAHLIRGTSPETVFLSYFAKQTGPSAGFDGDIHFSEWDRRNFPMVSHLPDSFPIALGLAMASKLADDSAVTIAFCGEGATSMGAWHETMNFASVFRLPAIFVIENNRYAYSTPKERQYRGRLVDRALGYGMRGVEVDGNDALAVYGVASEAVEEARSGSGPVLIEAHTMRMDGHAGHDDAAYVPTALLEEWRTKDPIRKLNAWLEANDVAPALIERHWLEARSRIDAAAEAAKRAPDPQPGDLAARQVFAAVDR